MDSDGLSILNPHPSRLPGPDLLHHLVTSSSPSTALEYLGNGVTSSFSYQDLHDASDALAARITKICKHDASEIVVPVLIHQSPQLYISLLAILKAGGAFCPLNADAPPERVKFILKDVAAKVVLVSEELASKLAPENGVEAIIVNGQFEHRKDDSVVHRIPSPEDLAYVMYTSGSTGTPKGVGISHDAATQALLAHDRHIPAFSRFLQFAAPTFDVSVFEIFFPLYRGSTLISVHREDMLDDLPGVLRKMEVDACELTPTVAGSLLRSREAAPKLRLLLTIGEMLNASVVQEFGGSADKDSMLWAMYGPTEATIHCTLQCAYSADSTVGNIGEPLDSVSCFIIEPASSSQTSSSFKILPRGEVGELAVGGYQLARCYLNRPEQTNASFISTSYGTIYRTGDKARLNSDGTLECLGRLTEDQVKLRGQRLELGEVQQAVLRTPGCHGAVVAVVNSILVAFTAVDAGVTEDKIMETCRSWLPQFMVPGEIVIMKEFPRLPSGKVDTRQLKADLTWSKADDVALNEPSQLDDVSLKEIAVITSTVLGATVSTKTNLASAGLDSLKAIRLASSLRAAGFDATASNLLKSKTLSDILSALPKRPSRTASLADSINITLLGELDEIIAQNASLELTAESIDDILPCTPLQSAMLAETSQNPTAYCNEVELEVTASASKAQIMAAFADLVKRNEILRTGFIQWRDKFISVLFKPQAQGQVEIVANFDPDFNASQPKDWLRPFRVQILDRGSENDTRVLLHLHHAIYDGWSLDSMLLDLSQMLNGVVPNQRPSFREVIKHYHQSTNKRNDDLAKVFWTDHLLGWSKPPFPKLAASLSPSTNILTVEDTLAIPPSSIEEAAQKINCSSQVFFQTALAIVWGGILGVSDVLLGSVTSGRSIPVDGIDCIIGPCIASVPLRVDFSNMFAVKDVLISVNTSNRAIMEHSTLALSEIKKLVGVQAGESLYDVLFVFQQSLDSDIRQKSAFRQTRHIDRLETKMLLEVEPREDCFGFQATYHSSHIPTKLAHLVIEQLKVIVEKLIEAPSDALQYLKDSVTSDLSTYNQKHQPSEASLDLASLFESMAAKIPMNDAICFASNLVPGSTSMTSMSYERLNARSNQIARLLIAQGVQTGQVVGIIMEKSIDLYTRILGIVKAGCAYLPLLPSTPIARVREILTQAHVEHCVVDDASWNTFSNLPSTSFLNIAPETLDDFSTHNLQRPLDGSRLAYVIYTSGTTTGVPKGVAVTQKNIASNVAHLESVYPKACKGPSRLLQACSQAFDVSVFEIFFAWYAGMCLCAGTNDVLFEDLENAIRQMKITHLSLTPTVAALIDPRKVPSVELLVTSGEPMTQPVLESWGELLWQGYGPSETTNICSVKQMRRGEYIEHLGWVFPNTSVFVFGIGTTKLVPRGWVGEFCFGGDQIAVGYLNMPNVTAEKFIQHPDLGRIYRSGDMGRMLPDGSLVILGRLDGQIKLRGQRIEASEINSVITGTRLAESAVTILVRRESGAQEQLVAFYLQRKLDGDFGAVEVDPNVNKSLFGVLQSKLPSYMIPSYLIPLSHVPLTPSGKLDRRRLQSCFEGLQRSFLETAADSRSDVVDAAEWNQVERDVADVISQYANVAATDIGLWTRFVTFGLDSISAIGIARALAERIGVRLPVSAILQHPSVAQLSRFLSQTTQPQKETENLSFFSDGFIDSVRQTFLEEGKHVASVLPCSPLQEAMLSYGQGSYYNKILLRLHIKPSDVTQYWNAMSVRHGILRTAFVTTDDADRPIAQVVLSNWELPWRSFDVTEPSLDGAIHEHLRHLPEPLDSRTPPVSLALIRYKGSTFLSFICHHALYDGVAMENLWREVETMANGGSLLPPVPYEPFLREALTLPADTEDFWRLHFRDFNPSTLFYQPVRRQIDQCTHIASVDMPFKSVQERLRVLGVSLLSLCQASWANVLAIASNTSDVSFGNVMSGRTLGLDGLDRLVAPCFNTVPIRKDVSAGTQNIDLLKSFQRQNSDLLHYQFTPLRMIQKVASRQRRNLFDTLLLLQRPLQDMDASVWTLEEDSGDMDIPLVCELIPCPNLNSIVIHMHHDMNIVRGDVAGALTDLFKYIFKSILDQPFASPVARETIPESIKTNLQGLVARQDRDEEMNSDQATQEPWVERELQIRDILAKLSKTSLSKIRRQTSIFQLGLDSINAVQIASLLKQQGYTVSASDVMECPTCTKLAVKLSQPPRKLISPGPQYDFVKFSADVVSQVEGVLPTDAKIEAILPCTAIQSAMLVSFVQSGGVNYLNMLSYELDEAFGLDQLRDAWNSLRQRHPMLRTGFAGIRHPDSSFAMVRYQMLPVETPITEAKESEGESFNVSQWKSEAAASILDQLHLPPWRVSLVQGLSRLTMHILIHHALYDAQSLDAMLGDVSTYAQGKETSVFPAVEPGLSLILSDSLGNKVNAQTFWEAKASDAVVNTFPVMTPLREDVRTVLTYSSKSSMALSQLQKQTQITGISIQALIQAAWVRVLASYLGEDSVVFGITLSGRTTDETNNAPFPCIATVPIVAANRSSNSELLRDMMDYNAKIHKYQFTPLSDVQRWLGHPATPIFDTLLAYQKLEKDHATRPWRLLADEAKVEYAVSLEVEPLDNDEIRLALTYFSDILPERQASLVVQQFDAIMKHMIYHPEDDQDDGYQYSPSVFAVSPAVSSEITAPVQYLHQFVEARAISDPEKIALEFASGFNGEIPRSSVWSYRDFDEIGNRVANMLKEEASVGSIVAVHFEKCPEAYFCILGILKAGCSFVALDPSAPKARKEFILQDSQAPCLLTDGRFVPDFEVTSKVIRINEADLSRYPSSRRSHGEEFTVDSTCYCLYTSGTTGTPKGCEITHDNAVQAMMAFQELFSGHWDEDSKWLQFAALHFDVSVLEQYWSWAVGIRVVAAPRDLILDDLTGSIKRLGITHIDLTPSLARLTHPDEVPNLCKGVFITGGEQLKQEILDAWGPTAVIYNAYGPTEATIGVTMYQRVPINGRPSNIGKQFPNVGSYVFRPGTEIPILRGAVGELCVSGRLVGKGYLNRPELTAERFPVLDQFNEKIYRTGDLVRILHDGCFEFLGRADDQVKLRGQRLEIGEINHTIRTGASNVRDAATIVIRHGSSGKDVLVSFIVGEPTNEKVLRLLADEDGLGVEARSACRKTLPGYMIPTYFLRLPFIPLSPNNKVEAKELKALFGRLSHEELMQLTARNMTTTSHLDSELLQKVIQALAEFCNTEKDHISQSTSIFDLGVDSIIALQLSSFMKSRGISAASPVILLRNPLIADLVVALSESDTGPHYALTREAEQMIQACHHRHRTHICRELAVKPSDIEYIAPCSPLQQGMLSRAITEYPRGPYFNTFEMELKDGTPPELIRQSWDDLILSTAILRTSFVNTSDGHIQVALKNKVAKWHEHKVDEGDDVDQYLAAMKQDWVRQNDHHVTNAIQFLHISGPTNSKIIVHIFHALYDGTSFDLMMQAVLARFQGQRLPDNTKFIDALAHGPLWKHDYCQDFWTEYLRGWTPSQTTSIFTESAKEPVCVTRTIPTTALEYIRRKHNVTLQSVVLALWTCVLQKHFANSLTMGIVVAGRSIDLPDAENVIGPLFNTIPFFNKSLRGQTWESLIKKSHEFTTAVLPFQHVPLKDIQKWCARGRPLFDNLFAFQVQRPEDNDQEAPWTIDDGALTPDYPLAFEATKLGNEAIRISIVAQAEVASVERLEDLLRETEDAIALMAANEILDVSEETSEPPADEDLQPDVDSHWRVNGSTPFEWDSTSLLIREEMATLADISPEEVEAHQTTLELGLDSIDIIKLSARLRKHGIDLSASQLMRHQTIARMTNEAVTLTNDPSQNGAENIALTNIKQRLWAQIKRGGVDTINVEDVLPPTALQESMTAGMIESGFEWYFNHDILEILDGVDEDKLRDSWTSLINNSPILRTGFVQVDDQDLDMAYCQVIHKPQAPDIKQLKLERLSDLHDIIRQAKEKAKDGKARNHLLQLTFAEVDQRNFIVLSIAHALYDGWSLSLLYQDLQSAYDGNLQTRNYAGDFISRSISLKTTDAKEFWSSYLDGASPTILPAIESGIQLATDPVFRHEALSSTALLEAIEFCKKLSISVQALCQACWAVVLAHRTASLDVTFGVVLSGRDFEGAEELMFPTINTIAQRCVLHGAPSTFLRYLEESMTDVRDFQAFPLRRAQLAAGVAGELFNSLFMLQKSPSNESQNSLFKSVDGSSALDYPVCVEAEAVGADLIWRVACQSAFFSEKDTRNLIGELDQVLEFFTRTDNSEMLSFKNQQVSICGLRHVTIVASSQSDNAQQETHSIDASEVWDEISMAIRKVLAQTSEVPLESINISSTLYQLGLDSINAIKVSLLLRNEGINLKPRELLKSANISQMADIARLYEAEEAKSQKPSNWTAPASLGVEDLLVTNDILKQDVEAILPALPMQVHMMSAWQNSDGAVFQPDFCYRLMGSVSEERIYQSWQLLVAQTPLLRTMLVATGNKELPFLQVILKQESASVQTGTHPLVRFSVEQDSQDIKNTLIRLRIHHALYDGVSLPAILKELCEILENKVVESISDQFTLSEWVQHAAVSTLDDQRQARRKFWTGYLHNCHSSDGVDLPSLRPSDRVSLLQRGAISNVLFIRAVAAEHNIGIQAVFLAAYAKTAAAQKRGDNNEDQNTLVFGIYLANRATEHDVPTTYPTLNLVPLKVRFGRNDKLTSIASAIQEDIYQISADGRSDVGLWEIAEWTGIKVESFVNFLSLPDMASSSSTGLTLEPVKDTAGLIDKDGVPAGGVPSSPWIQNNAVRDAYPQIIDIEASVNGQSMDIGIFGPRERVSDTAAAVLIQDIVACLAEVA